MSPRLIVFDLDGTLIDSRIDLCNSVNATLKHLGKPPLTHDTIASYIGDGADVLVRRAVDDDQVNLGEALTFFLDYYRKHKLDDTYVYRGVFPAVESLHRTYPEAAMAVLTNKPVNPSREICDFFRLSFYFFQNYGGNSFGTKKPDPIGLNALMTEASALPMNHGKQAITAAETILIGDSHIDIRTARNAGCKSIGCTFGLSPETLKNVPPDILVDSPYEWPAAVASLFANA